MWKRADALLWAKWARVMGLDAVIHDRWLRKVYA